ncbi:MAG: phosphoribosylglycinamide formyltransferase [Spirochaetaceae bacterium]|nr:phosphoribosylglycinamide formyltransferase [Spirochaetaceae bacterium]
MNKEGFSDLQKTSSTDSQIRVAVLISGGGTNLQAIIDEERQNPKNCPYKVSLVISSTKNAFGLERAKKANIPALVASPYSVLGEEQAKNATREEKRLAVSRQVLNLCQQHQIQAIVLAGFLTVLSGSIVDEYSGRIINLHPALLPKFGGVGMWGHHVHEAVIASGATESGCTVHLVDKGCDTGEILLQRKVPVLPGDTPETLYARIAPEEHSAMVEGIKLLAKKLKV